MLLSILMLFQARIYYLSCYNKHVTSLESMSKKTLLRVKKILIALDTVISYLRICLNKILENHMV